MLKKLSIFPVLAFVSLTSVQAVAQQTQPPSAPQPPEWYWGPGPWHMWGGGYGFWWMPLIMMLFMILFGVFVMYLLFARGSGIGPHHGWPSGHPMDRMWSPPTHSALQILNERFAKGEIQKEEYEDKKDTILSGGSR